MQYYPSCEMDHKKFWFENARSDWTILDVGANVGIFAILFSKLCHKVYAFEPIAETLEKLRANIVANAADNIEVIPLAVSDKSGNYRDKIHSIWEHEIQDKAFDFITIDDWVAANNVRVDAIKIDVDGFDYEVLLGAENTLRAQKPLVVVEINHALSTRNVSLDAPREFMRAIGYKTAVQIDDDNVAFKWELEK